MEAGRPKTLLRIRYVGITRKVEPYSLVYKKPKDRPAREYLYFYDQTGGASGNRGIKAFVQENIQSIETTDEGFEPRHEVELAKAGELGDKMYFNRPFSSGRTSGPPLGRPSRRLRSGSGIVYVIECPYCLKKFRRSTRTTKLNKHKDRFGNACYGRVGVYVDQEFKF